MADQQFQLQAVFTAQVEALEAGLSRATAAINSTSEALQAKMTAAAERANAALERTASAAESSGSGFNDAMSKMGESVKRFVEILGVLEGVRWVGEQVKQALEAGEALRNLSLETGISTQHLQELQFAAAATGANVDSLVQFTNRLTMSFVRLSTASGSYSGRGIGAVMQSAGLTPADLQNSYTALLKISDAINRLGPESAASRALLVELGGRSAAALAPAIARFREFQAQAEQMGLVLSDSTIAALDHAQEQFNVLGYVIKVDEERLGAALAPALQVVAELLTQLAEKVNQLAQGQGIQKFALEAANDVIDLAEGLLTGAQSLETFAENAQKAYEKLENFETAAKETWNIITAPVHAMAAAGNAVGGAIGASIAAGIHGKLPTGADLKAAMGVGATPTTAGPDQFAAARASLEELRAEIARTAAMPEVKGVAEGASGGGTSPAFGSAVNAQQAARKKQQAAAQELENFTQEQALEVAVAGGTADQKIAAAQKVYEKAVALFGAQSKQAERAAVAELNLRRQQVQQTEQLYATQVQQVESVQQGQFAVEKAQLAQATALHQISRQQELQGELALAAQEEALRVGMYDRLAALYASDAQKHQQFLTEKLKSELSYQQQVIQLQTQIAQAQQQQSTQAANTMKSVFQGAFSALNQAGRGWASVGETIFQQMLSRFESMTADMLANWLSTLAPMKFIEGLFGGGAAAPVPGAPQAGAAGAAGTAAGAGAVPLASTMQMLLSPLMMLGSGLQKLEVVMALLNSTMLSHMAATIEHIAMTTLNTIATDANTLETALETAATWADAAVHAIFGAGGAIVPAMADGGVIASAAGGMVARGHGRGFPAILHAREMVLPAKLSDGIQNAINWDRGLGGAGAAPNVHIQFGDMSAMDSEGMDRVLADHGDRIANTVADHFGRLGGRFRD